MTDSPTPDDSCPSPPAAPAAEAAFVLCVEDNETRPQALLLIESLRAFGGRFARSPVFAVAPRAGLGVDSATRRRLEELGATYHAAPLNSVCPEYGSANRVYAAAWAAEVSGAEALFVLDSDTLFLAEPETLDPETDVLVRPVDFKGSATSGAGDPFEPYWSAICELAGISVDDLPFVETVFDRARVRAAYNGGYTVVRRSTGILQRAAEIFTRSVEADLRPYKGRDHGVFASLGLVAPRAGEYWGSNHAALSAAVFSTTRRVRQLDLRYNVPLNSLARPEHWRPIWSDSHPAHVHYHWLLRPELRPLALETLERLGVTADQRDWIEASAAAQPSWGGPSSGPDSATSRPLVICGMHRSGTSLVASVLRRSGLDVGSELLGVGPGNWRGHFEDRGFWHLHEDMLAAAGTTALAAGEDFQAPADPRFERRARELVAARTGARPWGWKDPRSCLFLDFWGELLPQANFLFLYRHPLDVVLSLQRRTVELGEPFDPASGLRSWEVHNRRVLAFCERHPQRSFLAEVPALTADLPGFVRRLAETFGLDLRADGSEALFAPGELRGTAAAGGLRLLVSAIAPGAEALFRQLQARADVVAEGAVGAATGEARGRDQELAVLAKLFESQAAAERESGAQALRLLQGELANALGEAAELRRRLAAAESLYASAASRRDELSETLTTIERSRTFGIVAAWWWLTGRFRRSSGPSTSP